MISGTGKVDFDENRRVNVYHISQIQKADKMSLFDNGITLLNYKFL